jgi:ligand-binding SRPBCC domain-containing protein
MKLYMMDHRQVIRASIGDVWSFYSDPHNLAKLTPPWLNLVVPEDIRHQVYPGMIITYCLRPFLGIRSHWLTEITHVVEGQLFVDEQRFVPYRFWHHQHHFRETDEGIEVRDLIHYALPLDPVGKFVHAVLVRARLKEIFDYRANAIRTAFGQKA